MYLMEFIYLIGKIWHLSNRKNLGGKKMEDMKIEIGEFIRSKKGLIAKVLAYQDLTTFDDKGNLVSFHSFETDKGSIADVGVAKHDKDLLKLIEYGDVLKIEEGGEIAYIGLEVDAKICTYAEIKEAINDNEVKLLAIITKEQVKSIEYEIKKED